MCTRVELLPKFIGTGKITRGTIGRKGATDRKEFPFHSTVHAYEKPDQAGFPSAFLGLQRRINGVKQLMEILAIRHLTAIDNE